ncbi:MAG: thiamine-binding protein [Chitinophagaceae bacterium]|nr:thiamine-binding protein [Chitinophagaceae bacterium]
MHQFIVNASIQILPVVQDRHPYEWVDEAIERIRQSGIKYEVGPFATVIEGSYNEVMAVLHEVNEYLYTRGCPEWIASTQLQIRCNGDITADEKVEKHRQ